MRIISLIALVLLISCVSKTKVEDEKFKEWFNERLEIIDDHFSSKIYDEEFLNATVELYLITEIQINADVKMYSDFLGRPDSLIYKQRDYENDKKKYLRWYDKNYSEMNINKVDSILKLVPN